MTKDWRKIYAGRDAELGELLKSWEKVKSGGGPHVHVVRGERGMGKTRLVQEFYHHIATHDDPDNYWPDDISTDGNTLLPGPDPDFDPMVKAHFESFNLKERIMPFLWWGFRIADPQRRNVNTTKLSQHATTLTPHLVPLTIARELAILRKKSGRGFIKGASHDILADLGTDFIEGLLAEIPGISTASTIYGVGKRIVDMRKNYKKEIEDKRQQQNRPLSAIYANKDKDIQDSVLDQLKLLNPKSSERWEELKSHFGIDGPPAVPAILFMDDAQFTGLTSGSGVLSTLAQIWTWAKQNNFPLLILATHWNYEWETGLGQEAAENPDRPTTFVQGFQPRTTQDKLRFSETVLGSEVDLGKILSAALPELTDKDSALILEKSDGNPMLLREMLEQITEINPDWSDGERLTRLGRRRIEEKRFELHDLIKNRLEKATPVPIRKAVLISALQGVEFIEAVTLKAAEELDIKIGKNALRLANSPHAFIDFLDESKAAFIQRAVYDAALSIIDDNFKDRNEVIAALRIATDILIADQSKSKAVNVASEAQLQQLKGLEIGYGLESDDPRVLGKSLESLEHDMERLYYGQDCQRDILAAAELAKQWWDVFIKRSPEQVSSLRYKLVLDILKSSLGLNNFSKLLDHAVNDIRGQLQTDNTIGSIYTLPVILRYRGELKYSTSEPETAKRDLDEALEINRKHALNLKENASYPEPNVDGLDRKAAEAASSFVTKYNKAMQPHRLRDAQSEVAYSMMALAKFEANLKHYDAAIDLFDQSIKIGRELLEKWPGFASGEQVLSRSLSGKGSVLLETNNPSLALKTLKESPYISYSIESIKDDSDKYVLLWTLILLGDATRMLKRDNEAYDFYNESLGIARVLAAEMGTPGSLYYLKYVEKRLLNLDKARENSKATATPNSSSNTDSLATNPDFKACNNSSLENIKLIASTKIEKRKFWPILTFVFLGLAFGGIVIINLNKIQQMNEKLFATSPKGNEVPQVSRLTPKTSGSVGLNIRSAPSLSGAVLGSIKAGEYVDLCEGAQAGWVKVKSRVGIGYVSADFAEINDIGLYTHCE